MKTDDTPKAFPVVTNGIILSHGMALRDYFAIHCTKEEYEQYIPRYVGDTADLMVKLGWLSKKDRNEKGVYCYNNEHSRKLVAWARYQFADEMLKARGDK